jgi:hypothetical protein
VAALRKQKTKTNSGVTAKGNVTLHPNKLLQEILSMNNYFRITAYHPEKDISIIMDSFGLFEKKWQFSADLIKKGFKILEVSDDSQFTEGNIPLLVEPSDKYILRAYKTGKPTIENGKVEINGKFYAPDN